VIKELHLPDAGRKVLSPTAEQIASALTDLRNGVITNMILLIDIQNNLDIGTNRKGAFFAEAMVGNRMYTLTSGKAAEGRARVDVAGLESRIQRKDMVDFDTIVDVVNVFVRDGAMSTSAEWYLT
jgi:hypothetical protein